MKNVAVRARQFQLPEPIRTRVAIAVPVGTGIPVIPVHFVYDAQPARLSSLPSDLCVMYPNASSSH